MCQKSFIHSLVDRVTFECQQGVDLICTIYFSMQHDCYVQCASELAGGNVCLSASQPEMK